MKYKQEIRLPLRVRLPQPDIPGSGTRRRFNAAAATLPVLETVLGQVNRTTLYALPRYPFLFSQLMFSALSDRSLEAMSPTVAAAISKAVVPVDGNEAVGLMCSLRRARRIILTGPEIDVFRAMCSYRLSSSINRLPPEVNPGTDACKAVLACNAHANEWHRAVVAATNQEMCTPGFQEAMRLRAKGTGFYRDSRARIREGVEKASNACITAYLLYCVSKLLPKPMLQAMDDAVRCIGIENVKHYASLVAALARANGQTERILAGIGRLAGPETVAELRQELGIPEPERVEEPSIADVSNDIPAIIVPSPPHLSRKELLAKLNAELNPAGMPMRVAPQLIAECVKHRLKTGEQVTACWNLAVKECIPPKFIFKCIDGRIPLEKIPAEYREYREYRKNLAKSLACTPARLLQDQPQPAAPDPLQELKEQLGGRVMPYFIRKCAKHGITEPERILSCWDLAMKNRIPRNFIFEKMREGLNPGEIIQAYQRYRKTREGSLFGNLSHWQSTLALRARELTGFRE
jgi:hypothetical protein